MVAVMSQACGLSQPCCQQDARSTDSIHRRQHDGCSSEGWLSIHPWSQPAQLLRERKGHINLRKIPGTPAGCPWDTRRDKQGSTGRCPGDFLLFTIEKRTEKGIFAGTPAGCPRDTRPSRGLSEILCDFFLCAFSAPYFLGDHADVNRMDVFNGFFSLYMNGRFFRLKDVTKDFWAEDPTALTELLVTDTQWYEQYFRRTSKMLTSLLRHNNSPEILRLRRNRRNRTQGGVALLTSFSLARRSAIPRSCALLSCGRLLIV